MKEKYKYVFMKYLYNKLNLKEVDSYIEKNGIVTSDDSEKLFQDISKYFNIMNDVDDSRLSADLNLIYNKIFSLPIEEILKPELSSELGQFLENSYQVMLFPNIESNVCFYGPINNKYIAPRDSIALGFNYKEFSMDDNEFDEVYEKQEEVICNALNYIQDQLGPNAGMKIAVLKYNEFFSKVK